MAAARLRLDPDKAKSGRQHLQEKPKKTDNKQKNTQIDTKHQPKWLPNIKTQKYIFKNAPLLSSYVQCPLSSLRHRTVSPSDLWIGYASPLLLHAPCRLGIGRNSSFGIKRKRCKTWHTWQHHIRLFVYLFTVFCSISVGFYLVVSVERCVSGWCWRGIRPSLLCNVYL